jgi:hypothetical protein
MQQQVSMNEALRAERTFSVSLEVGETGCNGVYGKPHLNVAVD